MKVKDLIDQLKTYDSELPVVINLTAYGSCSQGNIQDIKWSELCDINNHDGNGTKHRAVLLHFQWKDNCND